MFDNPEKKKFQQSSVKKKKNEETTRLVSREVEHDMSAEFLRGGRVQVKKIRPSNADAEVLLELPFVLFFVRDGKSQ